MSEQTDLARKLTEAERDQSFPNRIPKDAATLILIDRTGSTPKVLLGRRHASHVFMPGKFVFPGGSIDPQDRMMAAGISLNPHAETKLMQRVKRPTRIKARALALAAIRETFEETGLLIGSRRDSAPAAAVGTWSDFIKTGFYPDLSHLHFVARAITPPRRPRRFDTRFFSADATAVTHRVENVVHAGAELVELTWVPIAQAQRLDMPAITGVVLQELEARIAAGFGYDLPVPFYRMLHKRFVREVL
jgi:8-oxo-dGTP pyrophosphatase MutT (NUDIX family)